MRVRITKQFRLLSLFIICLMTVGQPLNAANKEKEISAKVQEQFTLTGIISDPQGEPIIGATITVAETSRGTFSDETGAYSLEVSAGDQVEFSYVGYQTQLYTVTTATYHDVIMQEDALKIDDVVVTALGIKRSAKALGYAAQELGGESLAQTRQPNLTNALSGKVPGLQISKGGGPTGSSKIILRGQNSLTGSNQPLIVVDGVPIDNFTGGNLDAYGNQGVDMGNGLSDINADDIESMTVLKGGSAAALYGSRAGNGVILITTKSGKTQTGLGITVSSSIGFEDILVSPEMQNSYSQGYNSLYDNLSRNSWGIAADGVNSGTNWRGQNEILKTYDNVKNFFGTGVIYNESVTFQQQINKTSVYASVSYMNDKSMIPETNMKRANIVARATTNLGADDRWKLDFKINYINSETQNRPVQGINQSNTFYTIYNLPRTLNINDFNPSIDGAGNQIWWDTQNTPQDNPWWVAQYNKNHDERNRYIGFMSLSYKFLPWLTGEIKGGLDSYTTRRNQKQHTGGLSRPAGSFEESLYQFSESNYSFLFIAQKDDIFGKFGGSATFGGNLMGQRRYEMNASTGDLVVPNLFSINNGVDKPTINTKDVKRRMNSLYGSLQVNWNGALFLDATIRNDWSSTMSKANRSYLYPSVSFSGIISDLVKNMPEWFTFAKVRASYAEVGNDLDPYQLYNSFYVGKDIFENTTAWPGNTMYNYGVRSELIKSWEAGFDLRMFDNRLKLDFAWYKSNATRQLLDIPMDPTSGYASKKINAGNIQNQGIELSLGADIIRRAFYWNAQINFSRNKSKILDLTPGVSEYLLGQSEDIRVVAPVGGGYGDIYGSTIKRVTDKGSPYYGQQLLSSSGYPQQGPVMYLGNQQPKALIGFNNEFAFKNFTLGLMFDARIGGKIFSLTKATLAKIGNSSETVINGKRDPFVVNGVVADGNGGYIPNTTAITPQNYYNNALGVNNYGITEPYLYDASSVRLRTLNFGYNFPKKILGNAVQRLRLSFTANNLWLMYTSVKGIDPESVSGTGTNVQALELGVPPTFRSFTFNVTIGF